MAGFKSAYLQKVIVLDADVVGSAALKVGDVVTLTVASGAVPNYIAKSALANGTHIIAQSDMTLEYGHVPVEHRDYRYSNAVAATRALAPQAATTTTKKIALFKITDVSDVVLDAGGGDVAS